MLERHRPLLARQHQRPRIADGSLDDLGRAGSQYRQRLYAAGIFRTHKPGSPASAPAGLLRDPRWTGRIIPSTPTAGRDRLYHSYNLVRLDRPGPRFPIRRLYEMLEGQVAVLSSGQLTRRGVR